MRAFLCAWLLLASPVLAKPPPGVDWKKMVTHLREHQGYPATRAELITSCFDLQEFSAVEKKWFIDSVPGKKFSSADELIAVLSK
jgi:hypothetical protein